MTITIAPQTFAPSPEQQAVMDAVTNTRSSIILEAVAGSGKTTTLLMLLKLMKGSVALAAYNKSIANELTARIKEAGIGSNVRAGTFHGFGFGAWARTCPNGGKDLKVEDKKVRLICQDPAMEVPEGLHEFICQLVSLAKQHAVGVLSPIDNEAKWYDLISHHDLEEQLADDGVTEYALGGILATGVALAQKVYRKSIEQDRTIIDYDDMILAPLIHDVRMWQNDWVLIDEAQDTNPARRALAKKMLKAGGRIVAVGDPHQAIYGFTGADNDSLDIIRREFSCVTLPLHKTFRCAKSVVRLAQQWVPAIRAADTNVEGVVRTITEDEFKKLGAMDLTARDAVLCRNTKPLVALAYDLIRRGIPCHVEGRDIGRGLLALVNKWKVRSLTALTTRLEAYLLSETARLLAKGQEQKAASLADRVGTLQIIAENMGSGATVDTLRASINQLFGDTADGRPAANLTLSTVHKSKGREWDRVYLLGRNAYMPSPFARQEWQMDQEVNLMYVAVTRARKELVEIRVTLKKQEQ